MAGGAENRVLRLTPGVLQSDELRTGHYAACFSHAVKDLFLSNVTQSGRNHHGVVITG